MVIDTSALTAILGKEPECEAVLEKIARSAMRKISALTVLEAGMVIEARFGAAAGGDLELFLYMASLEIVPFDRKQADLARSAWRRFGKGNHPARLNLGDCCVYALAKVHALPILCKGADFALTDIPVLRV